MHIQQTDGITSPHSPFTKENNEKGIVEGKKLLEAIAASYEKEEKGMPPKTDKIVMALELFASNTEHPHEIKNNMGDKGILEAIYPRRRSPSGSALGKAVKTGGI